MIHVLWESLHNCIVSFLGVLHFEFWHRAFCESTSHTFSHTFSRTVSHSGAGVPLGIQISSQNECCTVAQCCNAHTLCVTLNQMHVTVGLLCCIKRINTQRKEVSKFHRLFYVMTHMSGARVQQAGCNCDFANICAKYLALTWMSQPFEWSLKPI